MHRDPLNGLIPGVIGVVVSLVLLAIYRSRPSRRDMVIHTVAVMLIGSMIVVAYVLLTH